uniref:CSON000820 protein n=1 Tax=Culicoides sonorensis TaxID=179676 RepID=A0A336KWQ3_CULSO
MSSQLNLVVSKAKLLKEANFDINQVKIKMLDYIVKQRDLYKRLSSKSEYVHFPEAQQSVKEDARAILDLQIEFMTMMRDKTNELKEKIKIMQDHRFEKERRKRLVDQEIQANIEEETETAVKEENESVNEEPDIDDEPRIGKESYMEAVSYKEQTFDEIEDRLTIEYDSDAEFIVLEDLDDLQDQI